MSLLVIAGVAVLGGLLWFHFFANPENYKQNSMAKKTKQPIQGGPRPYIGQDPLAKLESPSTAIANTPKLKKPKKTKQINLNCLQI